MRVEILNTGTELMLGHVVNKHLASIAEALFPLGLRVQRQMTVPDGDAIRDALHDTFQRADVVFVTGGLGPTTDDLTREIVADLLGLELQHDEAIWRAIQERFKRRGIPWSERVKLQALRPRDASVLPNPNGTAPGLHLPPLAVPGVPDASTPRIFLLPGPPRELLPMLKDHVVPILKALLPGGAVHEMRSCRIAGLGESLVEERVGADLLALGLEVGYCARPGEVDLRLIGDPETLAKAGRIIAEKLGDFIFTHDTRPLERVVIESLTAAGRTVAVAESCTGGFIANALTDVPGASRVFLAGYVTYANEAKASALGVDPALIAKHGAVSAPVARAMAGGAASAAGSHFALATTGIAGPDGGTPEKPVGTVFVALAESGSETLVQRHRFATDRGTFKHLVAQTAMDLLLRSLDGRGIPAGGEFSEGDGGCAGADAPG